MSYFVLRQEDPTKRIAWIGTRETVEEAEAFIKEDADRTAGAAPNAEVHYLLVQGEYYYGYQGQAIKTNPPGYL